MIDKKCSLILFSWCYSLVCLASPTPSVTTENTKELLRHLVCLATLQQHDPRLTYQAGSSAYPLQFAINQVNFGTQDWCGAIHFPDPSNVDLQKMITQLQPAVDAIVQGQSAERVSISYLQKAKQQMTDNFLWKSSAMISPKPFSMALHAHDQVAIRYALRQDQTVQQIAQNAKGYDLSSSSMSAAADDSVTAHDNSNDTKDSDQENSATAQNNALSADAADQNMSNGTNGSSSTDQDPGISPDSSDFQDSPDSPDYVDPSDYPDPSEDVDPSHHHPSIDPYNPGGGGDPSEHHPSIDPYNPGGGGDPSHHHPSIDPYNPGGGGDPSHHHPSIDPYNPGGGGDPSHHKPSSNPDYPPPTVDPTKRDPQDQDTTPPDTSDITHHSDLPDPSKDIDKIDEAKEEKMKAYIALAAGPKPGNTYTGSQVGAPVCRIDKTLCDHSDNYWSDTQNNLSLEVNKQIQAAS